MEGSKEGIKDGWREGAMEGRRGKGMMDGTGRTNCSLEISFSFLPMVWPTRLLTPKASPSANSPGP